MAPRAPKAVIVLGRLQYVTRRAPTVLPEIAQNAFTLTNVHHHLYLTASSSRVRLAHVPVVVRNVLAHHVRDPRTSRARVE